MYAVINSGGKQYRVEKDEVLRVELLGVEAGQDVRFDVALICDGDKLTVGNPLVSGAYAEAVVVKNGRGAKIDIFKYKAKKNERKRQGHRQPYSEIRIKNIVG